MNCFKALLLSILIASPAAAQWEAGLGLEYSEIARPGVRANVVHRWGAVGAEAEVATVTRDVDYGRRYVTSTISRYLAGANVRISDTGTVAVDCSGLFGVRDHSWTETVFSLKAGCGAMYRIDRSSGVRFTADYLFTDGRKDRHMPVLGAAFVVSF